MTHNQACQRILNKNENLPYGTNLRPYGNLHEHDSFETLVKKITICIRLQSEFIFCIGELTKSESLQKSQRSFSTPRVE